ncbi:hypothetical protein CROQUDRAFT_665115 [Cronartium quercuum f. sp. fusiforme G11]|uniref:Uncharacterized protein n=1 Tax=Cronartium quercuum f. sp. fusiforme G11 TaxID=708437 RepID=A0A9P6NAW9_9BASI|nr:hypothetical protein CROQUDRAFT_665115 [Cronartium quercuum f. sp. fusiforme G11]
MGMKEKRLNGGSKLQEAVDNSQAPSTSTPTATTTILGSHERLEGNESMGEKEKSKVKEAPQMPTAHVDTKNKTAEVWASLDERQRARLFVRFGLDYGSRADRNYFELLSEVGLVDLSMEKSCELWEEPRAGRLKALVHQFIHSLQNFKTRCWSGWSRGAGAVDQK